MTKRGLAPESDSQRALRHAHNAACYLESTADRPGVWTVTSALVRYWTSRDGMGDDATDADRDAYVVFLRSRLAIYYPHADIDVQAVASAAEEQIVDETPHRDLRDVLASLWDEFCSDTALWPSTTVRA